jgi:hypothetical protein
LEPARLGLRGIGKDKEGKRVQIKVKVGNDMKGKATSEGIKAGNDMKGKLASEGIEVGNNMERKVASEGRAAHVTKKAKARRKESRHSANLLLIA